LNETEADKSGLRQTVRHYLVFGNEYRTVQKMNDQRILPTFAPSTAAAFLAKSIRAAPITVPESVKLYLRPFEDGTYLVRFHNMNPSQPVISYLFRQLYQYLMDGKPLSILLLPINLRVTGRRSNILGMRKRQLFLRKLLEIK
jgi:hypothetical protein